MKKLIKRNIIFYFILSFLIISCTPSKKRDSNLSYSIRNTNKNNKLYTFDIDNSELETIYLSKLFKRVNTIILETNQNALIGAINSMQVYKDSIFILDKVGANGVFLFNNEGRFLQRIGNIGQGPGEYTTPSDFTLDIKNKYIYILDSRTQKILKYSFENGNYIKTIKLKSDKTMSLHIQFVDNKLYSDAYYYKKSESAFLLQQIDLSTGKESGKWLQTASYNKNCNDLIHSSQGVFFDRISDSPKFIKEYMDTIISIDKNKIMPYISLKSKKLIKETDLNKIEGHLGLRPMKLIKLDLIYGICNYVAYNDMVLFDYIHKNSVRSCLYDIKSKKGRIAKGLIDDMVYLNRDNSLCPLFSVASVDGVYSYVNPEQMNHFLKLVKENKLRSNLDKLDKLKQLKLDTNPIIFIYN